MLPHAHRGAGILILILIISVVVIVGGLLLSDGSDKLALPDEQAACPADAKVCADGSVVVRSGAECAFALCPEESADVPLPGATTTAALARDGCVVSGCSREVCGEEEVMTACLYRPEFACYREAVCEKQANGSCGWSMTDTLSSCLATPPGGNFEIEVQ